MNSSFKNVRNASNDNFNVLYSYILNTMFTVGDYKYSSSSSDFNDWFLCDGRSLSASDYPDLFNIIGTSFGGGGGNFNLPDFRGRVFGMIGTGSGLTPRTLGNNVGAETHTLTLPQIPSHDHTGNTGSAGTHVHGVTDPGHTHTVNDPGHSHTLPQSLTPLTGVGPADDWTNGSGTNTGTSTTGITNQSNITSISIDSAGAHTHTIASNGGDQPHNNMQPTLFAGNVFILTKTITYFSNGFYGIMPVTI